MTRWRLPLWLEIVGAILLALALSNLATIALFRMSGEQQFMRFAADIQAQRIAGVMNIVLKAPSAMRPELAVQLSTPGLALSLDQEPLARETSVRDEEVVSTIAARLLPERRAGLRARVLNAQERATYAIGMFVSAPADAGRWLNVRFGMDPPYPPAWPLLTAVLGAVSALVLASLWVARRVTWPLQRLAEAARSLRLGELQGLVPVSGPAPVREAARAFNAMSERVTTTLKSQKALMAAVAHDLRTPIAALRFRVEAVSDVETRSRLLETIGEMQGMAEAVLNATRVEGSGEAARAVDVGVLTESLCADMAEVGSNVSCSSNVALVCLCRPGEIRRALRNLIENALRYGGGAVVSTATVDGAAQIFIDDAGPGIPQDQLERVFEPFARLEESRSAGTGGYGLGLAIARLIARGHGGDVVLGNRAEGGLRATLTLPLS